MMSFIKRLAGVATRALLLGSGLIAPEAQASYVVTLQEVASDVVAMGSGVIDPSGFRRLNTNVLAGGATDPLRGAMFTGGTGRPVIPPDLIPDWIQVDNYVGSEEFF